MVIPRILQVKNLLPQTMFTSKLLPLFRYEKQMTSDLTPSITYKYKDVISNKEKNITIYNNYAEHYTDAMQDQYPFTKIETEVFHLQYNKQVRVKEELYTSIHTIQHYKPIWYVSYNFTIGHETRFVQTQYITTNEMNKLYLHPPMNKETCEVLKNILEIVKKMK